MHRTPDHRDPFFMVFEENFDNSNVEEPSSRNGGLLGASCCLPLLKGQRHSVRLQWWRFPPVGTSGCRSSGVLCNAMKGEHLDSHTDEHIRPVTATGLSLIVGFLTSNVKPQRSFLKSSNRACLRGESRLHRVSLSLGLHPRSLCMCAVQRGRCGEIIRLSFVCFRTANPTVVRSIGCAGRRCAADGRTTCRAAQVSQRVHGHRLSPSPRSFIYYDLEVLDVLICPTLYVDAEETGLSFASFFSACLFAGTDSESGAVATLVARAGWQQDA